MTQFDMHGLRADNPQGWMAAIGVLQILDKQGKRAQLGWQQSLPTLFGVERDEVLEMLDLYLRQGSQVLDALATLPVAPKNNKIALDFTAGRVGFTDVIERMTKTVTQEQIINALTQMWMNKDDDVSLGWDPFAVKQAATFAGDKAPDLAGHRTELGGQWLAAESLPITCPAPSALKNGFQWVTWEVPLDLEGVYSVVQAGSNAWLGSRYRANIAMNGKFKVFLPAVCLT